jgi:hypothetical protein
MGDDEKIYFFRPLRGKFIGCRNEHKISEMSKRDWGSRAEVYCCIYSTFRDILEGDLHNDEWIEC